VLSVKCLRAGRAHQHLAVAIVILQHVPIKRLWSCFNTGTLNENERYGSLQNVSLPLKSRLKMITNTLLVRGNCVVLAFRLLPWGGQGGHERPIRNHLKTCPQNCCVPSTLLANFYFTDGRLVNCYYIKNVWWRFCFSMRIARTFLVLPFLEVRRYRSCISLSPLSESSCDRRTCAGCSRIHLWTSHCTTNTAGLKKNLTSSNNSLVN